MSGLKFQDVQMITGPAVIPSLLTQLLPLSDTLNAHTSIKEELIVHVVHLAEILKPVSPYGVRCTESLHVIVEIPRCTNDHRSRCDTISSDTTIASV
jgi:hypothetical protein